MNEIYVSTDVETDGPIPGPHSMLSLGSAAYTADKRLLATFSVNLHALAGAAPDPRTAAWWATQPDAWAACRSNPETPVDAMPRYRDWLRALPGKPVFVAYPAGFDFAAVAASDEFAPLPVKDEHGAQTTADMLLSKWAARDRDAAPD